ncbi:MAG: hypothetical protein EBQ86_00315, partial [Betaproteobacteria bacterium]|nr:hypothetical protein [Betaproteobacteria bacterium]
MSARFPVPSRLACLCVSALLSYGGAVAPAFAADGGGKPVMSPEAAAAEHKNDVFGPDPSYEA